MLTRYIKTAALIAAVLMFGVDVIAQDTALTVPPPFALHFDDTTLLSKADSSLRITRSRLQKMLQDSLHFTAEIHLVSSIERFDSLVGSGFPEWGAAAALPALNLIVIKSPNRFHTQRPLSELLAHE
ncbi:MAG: hypothetical protein KKA42_14355, partial [candidate division Zixibacteria bacterium]|nr:hypothetical protein [candidate division Zixibacteria bacterium]